MNVELKISGGVLYDGGGGEPVTTDVGIIGERIAAIGDLSTCPAEHTIDATGCCVTPGFIDVHSHSDTYLMLAPDAPNKLHQGITTEVVGNCGTSAAPICGDYQLPTDWGAHDYPMEWRTATEYRAALAASTHAPNVVLLAGHNTLRGGVVGYEARAATRAERAAMGDELRKAMDAGFRGISTGLLYIPGRHADRDEVIELCRIAAERGGIYATHMRSESDHILAALDEAITIAREAGIALQISHLKVSGRDNWHKLEQVLEKIEAARAEGLDVQADRYPYTASCTDLDILFPSWVHDGGRAPAMERLADPATRRRIHDELLASRAPDYWAGVTVGSTQHTETRRFQGMGLPEVASKLETDPAEAILWLTERDQLGTTAFFESMSPANTRRILQLPYMMIGCDASIRTPGGILGDDYPHPRTYGTFPRFLRMATDDGLLTLPEAIRRCTSLPAERFGLARRGRIANGYAADLAIFGMDALHDRSTFAAPHQLATGMQHVIINGTLSLSAGRLTHHRAGQVL